MLYTRVICKLQLPFLLQTFVVTLDSDQSQWNLFSGCLTITQTLLLWRLEVHRQAMASLYLVRAAFWWPFTLYRHMEGGQEVSGGPFY